jgi:predicted transcriptional regulator
MLPQLEEIAKKRRLFNLTQEQLAKMGGVSQSLIAKLESGKIEPAYTKVKALFDAFERLEMENMIRAKDFLHAEVVEVQKSDKVSRAVHLMMKHGYSQLPVFDGEHPVGSISEKTVLSQVLAGHDLTHVVTLMVGDIMDESFPQVGEDAPFYLISGLLQVYPAVLLSKKGKVAGIATKADLLKMFL